MVKVVKAVKDFSTQHEKTANPLIYMGKGAVGKCYGNTFTTFTPSPATVCAELVPMPGNPSRAEIDGHTFLFSLSEVSA